MPVLDGISAAEQIGKERIARSSCSRRSARTSSSSGRATPASWPTSSSRSPPADLAPAIDIARSRWGELKALEAEIADLGERLETRKAVDRAKGVLMTELKITEAEAFRWIQKTAMDRRLGMREVADAVIAGMDEGLTRSRQARSAQASTDELGEQGGRHDQRRQHVAHRDRRGS